MRPQRRKLRVGYCEPDDDSDEYANESADSDVGSEYQLSDLDERHDFIGFEEEELFSAEEDEISDAEGERGRGRVRGHRRARSLRPSWAHGGRRRMRRRRGEGEGEGGPVVTHY